MRNMDLKYKNIVSLEEKENLYYHEFNICQTFSGVKDVIMPVIEKSVFMNAKFTK